MAFKKLALILGNCLFPSHEKLSPDEDSLFFMAEDLGLCTHFKYHKHKLILFLAAMRHHGDCIAEHRTIVYWHLNEEKLHLSYEDKLDLTLKHHPHITEVVTYDIEDHFFAQQIQQYCEERSLKLTVVDSPGFITSKKEFSKFALDRPHPRLHQFYINQRKLHNILMDGEGKPLGGQWSFDAENRKKIPKGLHIPSCVPFAPTHHTQDVINLVDRLFADHPGSSQNFGWATTRRAALKALSLFLKERFEQFGPYEDAIERDHVFLFHSVLSPYINLGLLTPMEVLETALAYASFHKVHLPSVEGFIRQILGWREFMRGLYNNYPLRGNYFGNQRQMGNCWYQGTTGIPPLDDSIKKANRFAYTHHIERLMLLGNVMLLCELHPDEVYRWFMEMYVDSADWVMVPNVYGMSQYADGGIFATKPYIAGGNYMLKMSNYPKGEWVDVLNGLYWRFIKEHREVFASNQRMAVMVSMLDKMDPCKKEGLFRKANQFINQVTK